jgi:hypothetical protein
MTAATLSPGGRAEPGCAWVRPVSAASFGQRLLPGRAEELAPAPAEPPTELPDEPVAAGEVPPGFPETAEPAPDPAAPGEPPLEEDCGAGDDAGAGEEVGVDEAHADTAHTSANPATSKPSGR